MPRPGAEWSGADGNICMSEGWDTASVSCSVEGKKGTKDVLGFLPLSPWVGGRVDYGWGILREEH